MIIGALLAIVGVIIGLAMFGMDIKTAMQETTQFVGFACSSIFIVAGMIAINAQYVAGLANETNMAIAEDLARIRAHFDDQKKEREDLLSAERKKKEKEEDDKRDQIRFDKIKTMEDLLADPKIKEQADVLLRSYGKKVQEQFLERSLKEAGISVDEPKA